ncbi:hypothetical protein D039_3402A, partial [Vibrio parahaemolyticus EKP-028]
MLSIKGQLNRSYGPLRIR